MKYYSMLVVDDERLSREYVMNLLDWEKLGICSIYEADNCFSALSIIKEHRPEIIFLDIKMPEMSGVDLLLTLEQKNIDAEVIFLSGYSDFNLARQMLKSGKVVEYLLKPVSEDLAAEAVTLAISRIEKARELAEMKGLMSKVVENEKKRIYQAHICGYAYETDYSIEQDNLYQSMQVAVFYCETDHSELKKYCGDIIASGLANLQDFFMCEKPYHYALFFASDLRDMHAETVRLCESICQKTGLSCGLGRQYDNMLELNASYRQAYFSCEFRSFTDQRAVFIDDVSRSVHPHIDREATARQMLQYLQENYTTGIDELIMQIFKSVMVESPDVPADVAYNMGIAKAYFTSFIEALLPERKNNLNLSQIFAARNIYELFSVVKKTLHQSCSFFTQEKSIHKVNIVKQVKTYIHENYMKPISLDQAAGVVFITASYLSRLFSEVEGCGFASYVARVRVDEAKKLLPSRRYKIYEIAEMVGYKSFKHFLKMFKEFEGITPAQYRENRLFASKSETLQKNRPN